MELKEEKKLKNGKNRKGIKRKINLKMEKM